MLVEDNQLFTTDEYLTASPLSSTCEPVSSYQALLGMPVNEIGLNGNVRNVVDIKGGMSGGRVVKIDTDEGTIVVKHNPESPGKIAREIQGYVILASSPLANRLPVPIYSSAGSALHVLPYFDGIQMREGIKSGLLSDQMVMRVGDELLDAKKSWWSRQEKHLLNGDYNSMQRQEWGDTAVKLGELMNSLSVQYGATVEELLFLPVVINGKDYLPLSNTIETAKSVIESDPPYTVIAHGDLTGANIIVNPIDGDWKIVDAEWTGNTDPAEAYVRMIKQISTTTVKKLGSPSLKSEDGKLIIDVDPVYSDLCQVFQSQGLLRAIEFGSALNDEMFSDRVVAYLVGSYLREAALSLKRGGPEMGILALSQACQVVKK